MRARAAWAVILVFLLCGFYKPAVSVEPDFIGGNGSERIGYSHRSPVFVQGKAMKARCVVDLIVNIRGVKNSDSKYWVYELDPAFSHLSLNHLIRHKCLDAYGHTYIREQSAIPHFFLDSSGQCIRPSIHIGGWVLCSKIDRACIHMDALRGAFPDIRNLDGDMTESATGTNNKLGRRDWVEINPRPIFYHDGLVGESQPFGGLAKGSQDKVSSNHSHKELRTSQPKEEGSPKSHILLGLQILVGCLITVVGFKLTAYAVSKPSATSIGAGLCYFIAGNAAIIFGIGLISGIGTVYFSVF